MKNQIIVFCISVFIFFSCSTDAPDISGLEQLVSISNEAVEENVMSWVNQICESHLKDTPISNDGFPPGELFPSAHLTRDSAINLATIALKSMGYQPDTAVIGGCYLTSYNLFAEIKGKTHPEEVILIGSHIDAFYAGADDNTSAVAAMLEAARVLKNHTFDRTIRFVFFDLEEFGSIGSTRYVKSGYANDVKYAIVLDLIGFSSTEANSQENIMGVKMQNVGDYLIVIGNNNSADITQKVTALSNNYKISKTVGIIASGDGTAFLSSAFMRSDHAMFWYNGIPAIFFSDGANFRNKNYHKETDLPETLNSKFLYENTKVLIASIALLAGVIQ